jgi:hypothetical protein
VWLWLGAALAFGHPFLPKGSGVIDNAIAWMHVGALASGYLAAATLCVAGLKRRGLIRMAGTLAAMPALWVLLSVAAWRALYQLLRQPQLWEKTRHGRARTSRLKEGAQLTNSGAGRRRIPRACA